MSFDYSQWQAPTFFQCFKFDQKDWLGSGSSSSVYECAAMSEMRQKVLEMKFGAVLSLVVKVYRYGQD